MDDSSQGQTFTITLNDDYDFTTSGETITTSNWSATNVPALTTSDIITLTGGDSYSHTSPITVGTIESIDLSGIESFTSFTNLYKEEFDGRWPDYERVKDMCKEYPGLEIAYRKFKEVYKMVKEDYDGKERERRGKK